MITVAKNSSRKLHTSQITAQISVYRLTIITRSQLTTMNYEFPPQSICFIMSTVRCRITSPGQCADQLRPTKPYQKSNKLNWRRRQTIETKTFAVFVNTNERAA